MLRSRLVVRVRPFVRRRRTWNAHAIRRWCATNASTKEEADTNKDDGGFGAPPVEDAKLTVAEYMEKHKGGADYAYGFNPPDYDKLHPRDTPVWAAPQSQSGDYQGKELDEDHYTPGFGNASVGIRPKMLEMGMTPKYVQQGREDTDPIVHFNDPEWFLPEEPKLLEFWGLAPFVFFAGAAVVSKEWALLDEELAEMSWLVILGGSLWAIHRIVLDRPVRDEQFILDRHWQSLELMSESLNNMIGGRENEVRSVERGQQFDAYVRALNEKKSSYHAFVRHRDFNERILSKLRVVASAEKNFRRSLMNDVTRTVQKRVDEKLESIDSIRETHKANVLRLLEEASIPDPEDPGGKVPNFAMMEDPIAPIYQDVITSYLAELEKSADSTEKKGSVIRIVTTIMNNLTDLRVYDGDTKPPETKRSTGFFGALTPEQQARVPTAEHLKTRVLAVIDEQIDRFDAGKIPDALVERRALNA